MFINISLLAQVCMYRTYLLSNGVKRPLVIETLVPVAVRQQCGWCQVLDWSGSVSGVESQLQTIYQRARQKHQSCTGSQPTASGLCCELRLFHAHYCVFRLAILQSL